MKKTIKFLGIIALVAVIGFTMASCGDKDGDISGGDRRYIGSVGAPGSSKLTIEGLSAYEGNYVIALVAGNSLSRFFATDSTVAPNPRPVPGVKITSGKAAELTIWEANSRGYFQGNVYKEEINLKAYNHTGTPAYLPSFYISVINKPALTSAEFSDWWYWSVLGFGGVNPSFVISFGYTPTDASFTTGTVTATYEKSYGSPQ